MIEIILGLDISSSTIGYGVLSLDTVSKEIKFLSMSYIKPLKEGTIIERLVDTRDKIKKIIKDIKPTRICIEDILLFVSNKSTAQTIIVLAVFNRMIGLLAFDYLKETPSMYGVLAIRRALMPGKDLPAKEDMPELVAWHLNIKFPYEFGKKGKIKIENCDMADGCSVALMKAMELGGETYSQGPEPRITLKVKKTKKPKKIKKRIKK